MSVRPIHLTPLLLAVAVGPARAQADLNDLEMAHVAVTASNIDIAYAHLALAISENEAIRAFAETMIRDHGAVNAQVVALAERLHVQAQDNPFSQRLLADAQRIKDELTKLRGGAFDRYYATNELRYHQAVNGILAEAFIPNADNPEVRKAFESALPLFREHERHAERLATRFARGME
jgi:putative membrane protein